MNYLDQAEENDYQAEQAARAAANIETDDVEVLYNILPVDGKGLGTTKALQQLAWDAGRYEAAKAILIASGEAVPWKGRGGSIKRVNVEAAAAPLPEETVSLVETSDVL